MAAAKSREAKVFEQLDMLLVTFDGKQAALALELHVSESAVCRWSSRKSHPQPRHEHAITETLAKRRLLAAVQRELNELEKGEDEC